MGTFLTDKCIEIRNWLAIGPDVYPDNVVTSWIRIAEEYLSVALRVKHMIQIDTSTLVSGRAPLPLDWQEIRFVRRLDTGGVCRYQTPDAFFNPEFPLNPKYPTGSNRENDARLSRYCILGNYILVGNVTAVAPLQVELTYYQNIPPLTDDANNWINTYHPTVYTNKILHVAAMYAIEDERAPTWDNETVRMVNGMNAQHKIDMASGSVLTQVRKQTLGRKYGLSKYGAYTYDLGVQGPWAPIPGAGEIWTPITPPADGWGPAVPPSDPWVPKPPPLSG